ncbi:PREDICTED: olfactory receptor 52Z1-like [Nanorana parkeri]|uniref:olfactory receptor 52Z1-like n=1 Tax=Nanorana parkeri TaxID=125878 RepID=UPI000855053F|nr:PREDICTED: olfactory receptor 52Z1-like [Nanorana parkeri]
MANATSFHPDFFLLKGIPGLENSHLLLSGLFFFMYILGVAANSILIVVISLHESLHQPMYIFLVMLAVGDLVLCSSPVPKTLSIFWFGSHEISFNGCLVQIFFIHFICMTESAILLALAYDRYIAICYPLAYVTKLTLSFVRTAVSVSVTRSVVIMIPVILLLWWLPYQDSNVIEHTYCEHMAMARLATASILANVIYGMIIIILTFVIDLFLIGLSYVSIIQAVMRLSTSDARHKTSSTCVSHLCVITLLYVPAFFSFIAHRIPHSHLPPYVHILVANLYVIVPPMLNPIIYGVRTKEIRQKAIKMFTGKITGYH